MQTIDSMSARKKAAIINSYARNLPAGRAIFAANGTVWISCRHVGRTETRRVSSKLGDTINDAVCRVRPSADLFA